MEGDGSSHGMFTCMLKVLQCLKEWKEKKTKNEKKYGETQRSGKYGKEYICDFWIVFLKQSEKERKLMATNY